MGKSASAAAKTASAASTGVSAALRVRDFQRSRQSCHDGNLRRIAEALRAGAEALQVVAEALPATTKAPACLRLWNGSGRERPTEPGASPRPGGDYGQRRSARSGSGKPSCATSPPPSSSTEK